MKTKTGFWQELQQDGSISNSFMRLLESFFFGLLCAYTFFSNQSYESHFNSYLQLLRDSCITEQSFNMLVSQLKRIDWDIFTILVVATVVPKAIQKFAEMRTGINDTTEKTTETTITTDNQNECQHRDNRKIGFGAENKRGHGFRAKTSERNRTGFGFGD